MDGADGLGTDSQAPTLTIPLSHADQDLFTMNVSDALDTQESTPVTPSSGPVGEDPPPVKEQEIKYVLSGQPTGWAAMSNEVRDFDEEKVKSCKEDVDTLLVFAGLFSAILSAFLVAAYPNLQPSPMAVMNYNLERIAAQTTSYDFSDGKLVATTTLPSSPPPFQVADEDVHVNVLWFSSLILSLTTASLGMLVKQWLREFLAVENPSPQARLRIRHFREPQLRKWQVYEIVAFLPLLLQISLGLFFVGLCYFTSSIHRRVGHTTLPLVVGWAICFFGATALPIFFPRCPYRTTLLKAAIARLHCSISRLAQRINFKSNARNAYSLRSLYDTFRHQAFTYTAVFRQQTATRASQVDPHSTALQPTYTNAEVTTTIVLQRPSMIYTVLYRINQWWTRWETIVSRLLSVIWRTITTQLLSIEWWYTCYVTLHNTSVKNLRELEDTDERLLVENSGSDVDILVSVDAIQANDELLGTTIAEALRYTYPPRDEVCSFLIQMISHRVPAVVPLAERAIPEWPFNDYRPLEQLRPQASESIIHILHDYLGRLHSHHKSIYSGQTALDRTWLCEILLLTSVLHLAHANNSKTSNLQPITVKPLAILCLRRGIDYMCSTPDNGRRHDFTSCISSDNTRRSALLRLRILADVQVLLNTDIIKGAGYFACIWSEAMSAVKGFPCYLRWNPSEGDHFELAWDDELSAASLDYLCALLSSELASFEVSSPQEGDSRTALFKGVFNFARHALLRLVGQKQTRMKNVAAPLFNTLVLSVKQQWSADILLDIWESTTCDMKFVFLDRLLLKQVSKLELKSNTALTREELTRLSSCITTHLSRPDMDLLQLLGLCYAAIVLFLFVDAQTAGVDICREVYTRIASKIQSLNTSSHRYDQQYAEMSASWAYRCLANMEYERNWKNVNSIFPDEFIEALGELTSPRGGRFSLNRLRALERRRTSEERSGLRETGASSPVADQLTAEAQDEPKEGPVSDDAEGTDEEKVEEYERQPSSVSEKSTTNGTGRENLGLGVIVSAVSDDEHTFVEVDLKSEASEA